MSAVAIGGETPVKVDVDALLKNQRPILYPLTAERLREAEHGGTPLPCPNARCTALPGPPHAASLPLVPPPRVGPHQASLEAFPCYRVEPVGPEDPKTR